MTAAIHRVTGTVRDYAWGAPGGIDRALGRTATQEPQAELWLGAHRSAPSLLVDARWPDLCAWQDASHRPLPFLLKLLSAAKPLSLQAHPTPQQAAAGYAREEAEGIARDAPHRNYKDPFAKPELIVAAEDGFEALCGFQPVGLTAAAIADLAARSVDPHPFEQWHASLTGPGGIRSAFEWLLGGDPRAVAIVEELSRIAGLEPGRWDLAGRLAAEYPGDTGIAIALMLNHVTLARDEALWLPAGNIHAYLRGTGVELMGPSDNVLRGGLTPKHVDVAELTAVLDFTPIESPRLLPIPMSPNTVTYRPASQPSGAGVPFELRMVTGDDELLLPGPAIGLVTEGGFRLALGATSVPVGRGDAVFIDEGTRLSVRGRGRLALAV